MQWAQGLPISNNFYVLFLIFYFLLGIRNEAAQEERARDSTSTSWRAVFPERRAKTQVAREQAAAIILVDARAAADKRIFEETERAGGLPVPAPPVRITRQTNTLAYT